jgi:hypothetical protein
LKNLITEIPELYAEWSHQKNKSGPEDLTAGSRKKVWWLGKCGHEWEARIDSRVAQKAGCPYCSIPCKKILSGFNDLATKNPGLANEWNSKLNKELSPQQISPQSNKKVWWLGKCGHEWEAQIYNRTKGHGCFFCKFKITLPEHTIEEKFHIKKFDKAHLVHESYRPDFKLSEGIFLNADGLYWHSIKQKDKSYHFEMRKAYERENKRILQFYEDEIYEKWSIVESIINNGLGEIVNKVHARKSQMKQLTINESTRFLTDNHLMGAHKASKSIGLYYQNELVSVLSYKIIKTKNKIEIARFGSKINTVVIGAFGKLLQKLKEIAKGHEITQIESFCDLRYATGKSYEKMGFIAQKETLGWNWTDGKQRFNRLACKATKDKTEKENAKEKGWYKIYDAGQRKYVLTLQGFTTEASASIIRRASELKDQK